MDVGVLLKLAVEHLPRLEDERVSWLFDTFREGQTT
jgi:hypothetical protein